GREDFTPSVDEVKKLVLDIVGRYQTPWARQAEQIDDPAERFVKRVVSHARPVTGIRVTDLPHRVREEEPAADDVLLMTALYELGPECERRIKIIEHIEPHRNEGRVKRSRCWVLTRWASFQVEKKQSRRRQTRLVPTRRQAEAWALYAELSS